MVPYRATAIGVYNTASSQFTTIACSLCTAVTGDYGAFAGAAVWSSVSSATWPGKAYDHMVIMAPFGELLMPHTIPSLYDLVICHSFLLLM